MVKKTNKKKNSEGLVAAKQHIAETQEENGGRELRVVYEIKVNQWKMCRALCSGIAMAEGTT